MPGSNKCRKVEPIHISFDVWFVGCWVLGMSMDGLSIECYKLRIYIYARLERFNLFIFEKMLPVHIV